MPRKGPALIGVLIASAIGTACFSQENCIYKIIAFECTHEPAERTQTGFIIKGTRGIFTALHGVVDAKRIGAVSEPAGGEYSPGRVIEYSCNHG